jgi:hypothetical protein
MTSQLTFITCGPSLDGENVKAVRAHTTKANFIRRRQRIAQMCAARLHPIANLQEKRQLHEESHRKKPRMSVVPVSIGPPSSLGAPLLPDPYATEHLFLDYCESVNELYD